ncbi:WHG domain-containing protein [Arthrobacter koreensis]|uniref:WHG domain-containing protein n=1 Tax=Arthrobacter koreensis TaxID=199136 RepID=A0ABY6FUB4_9MICC|nr:TetR-like C-terminal domain-containing protein [Arthrobacter koreensis]UYB36815.1 WHG domain-containing protein [Arthrobacter koreensis]
MARPSDPAVRRRLLERAARMLRDREPVTLRSLVAGTGASTMAVYTHFGSMEGMWQALRQEGFTGLEDAFAAIPSTDDPLRDLTALVCAYLRHGLDHPDLYRVMFDASIELVDLPAADATLDYLVRAAARARDAGRLRPETVALDVATQSWAVAHGLLSLVAGGPLPREDLQHTVPILSALFAGAGDDPERASRSVRAGWSL